jgi:hypothetical protein
MERYNRERQELEQKLKDVQKESKTQVEKIYAPQQLKMDMYLRALESIVQAKQDKIKKRDDRLVAIRDEYKELKAKEKDARREAEQVRNDIAKLSETAVDGADEEISALFSHNQKIIKEVRFPNVPFRVIGYTAYGVLTFVFTTMALCIPQRAGLRQQLKEAQEENYKANEQLLEWEEKRINLTTNKAKK